MDPLRHEKMAEKLNEELDANKELQAKIANGEEEKPKKEDTVEEKPTEQKASEEVTETTEDDSKKEMAEEESTEQKESTEQETDGDEETTSLDDVMAELNVLKAKDHERELELKNAKSREDRLKGQINFMKDKRKEDSSTFDLLDDLTGDTAETEQATGSTVDSRLGKLEQTQAANAKSHAFTKFISDNGDDLMVEKDGEKDVDPIFSQAVNDLIPDFENELGQGSFETVSKWTTRLLEQAHARTIRIRNEQSLKKAREKRAIVSEGAKERKMKMVSSATAAQKSATDSQSVSPEAELKALYVQLKKSKGQGDRTKIMEKIEQINAAALRAV